MASSGAVEKGRRKKYVWGVSGVEKGSAEPILPYTTLHTHARVLLQEEIVNLEPGVPT